MVNVRRSHPDHGDQMFADQTPEQAADIILETRDNGWANFGVFEVADEQLELDMATRTGLINLFKEKDEETLRLVPVIAGG